MDWHARIAACFGRLGTLFASDAIAQSAAINLFSDLKKSGVSWEEAITGIAQYLLSRGCSIQHLDDQIALVEQKFRSWLE